ncbi:MAG: hypothetical protein NVS9B3_00520 [Gemmatimonadaceae bacterium]
MFERAVDPVYAAAGAVFAVWLASVIQIHELHELHHEWYGVALMAPIGPRWLRYLGLSIMADDAWQHLYQSMGHSEYRSPMHLAARFFIYEHRLGSF